MSLEIIKEKIHAYISNLIETGRLQEDIAKRAADTWWSDELAARTAAKLIYRARERLAEKSLVDEEKLKPLVEWAEANGYGLEDFAISHWIAVGPCSELYLYMLVKLINGMYVSWKASSTDVIIENLPKAEFLKFRQIEEELIRKIKALRSN